MTIYHHHVSAATPDPVRLDVHGITWQWCRVDQLRVGDLVIHGEAGHHAHIVVKAPYSDGAWTETQGGVVVAGPDDTIERSVNIRSPRAWSAVFQASDGRWWDVGSDERLDEHSEGMVRTQIDKGLRRGSVPSTIYEDLSNEWRAYGEVVDET